MAWTNGSWSDLKGVAESTHRKHVFQSVLVQSWMRKAYGVDCDSSGAEFGARAHRAPNPIGLVYDRD